MDHSKIRIENIISPQFDYAIVWQNKSWVNHLYGLLLNIGIIIFGFFYPDMLNNVLSNILVFLLSGAIVYRIYSHNQEFRNQHQLAERLKKLGMIRKIYGDDNNRSEEIRIKMCLNEDVLREAFKKQENKTELSEKEKKVGSTLDFNTDQKKLAGRFAENIQENCFHTSFYLEKYCERLKSRDLVIAATITIFIFSGCMYYFYVSEASNEVTQIAALVFSTIFSLNIFPLFSELRTKQQELARIEGILDKYKHDPNIKMEDIMYYFTAYNEITHNLHMWPNSITNKYYERVNKDWDYKVKND